MLMVHSAPIAGEDEDDAAAAISCSPRLPPGLHEDADGSSSSRASPSSSPLLRPSLSLPRPVSPLTPPPPFSSPDSAVLTASSLVSLFRFFLHDYSVSRSSRSLPLTSVVQRTCVELFSADYHVVTLPNALGEYCSTYPPLLIVIEAARQSSFPSYAVSPRVNDASELSALFIASRFNRVHGRFVCPVLLWRDANIARSSTLSVPAEAMYNNVALRTKELIGTLYDTMSASFRVQQPHPVHPMAATTATAMGSAADSGFASLSGSAREADEALLARLGTLCIFDLMVEQRKRKMGLTLTSSEKSEAQSAGSPPPPPQSPPPPPRPYAAFCIAPIPYPGCEFFALYRRNGRSPVGLVFDWTQSFVDSLLQLEQLDLDGVTLCDEADGPDAFYGRDTHWACWEKEQREQRGGHAAALSPKPSPTVRVVDPFRTSPPAPSPAASAAPPPLLTRVRDAIAGEPEDDDGVDGHIAAASGLKASDSAAAPAPSAQPWSAYRDWSVVTLTQNYLLLLLRSLSPASPSPLSSSASPSSSSSAQLSGGLSAHCISGWDRTPLFISLLRLSLWADGEAHPSLSAVQMLYLTLAYDWCLFSHHLANRHAKHEDILHFAFDFLQYITARAFSVDVVQRGRAQSHHRQPPPGCAQPPGEAGALHVDPKQQTPPASTSAAPSPLPGMATASDSPPTATIEEGAPDVDDGYFTTASAAPLSNSTSSSSPSPSTVSAPIPIPSARGSSLGRASFRSTAVHLQAASVSPPLHDALPLSSSAVAAHRLTRGGSWTMIDLLSTGGSGGSESSEEASEEKEAQPQPPLQSVSAPHVQSDSPPSTSTLPSASPEVDGDEMAASWTATWKDAPQASPPLRPSTSSPAGLRAQKARARQQGEGEGNCPAPALEDGRRRRGRARESGGPVRAAAGRALVVPADVPRSRTRHARGSRPVHRARVSALPAGEGVRGDPHIPSGCRPFRSGPRRPSPVLVASRVVPTVWRPGRRLGRTRGSRRGKDESARVDALLTPARGGSGPFATLGAGVD